MRTVAQAHRRGGARDFFKRDAMFEIAETGAAKLFFDRDSVQADRTHFRPEVARELVGAVDLGGARRNLILGEITCGRADHLGGLAEVEVEAGGDVGDHKTCPRMRPGTCRRRSGNSGRLCSWHAYWR